MSYTIRDCVQSYWFMRQFHNRACKELAWPLHGVVQTAQCLNIERSRSNLKRMLEVVKYLWVKDREMEAEVAKGNVNENGNRKVA
jgi:hypothetical protein